MFASIVRHASSNDVWKPAPHAPARCGAPWRDSCHDLCRRQTWCSAFLCDPYIRACESLSDGNTKLWRKHAAYLTSCRCPDAGLCHPYYHRADSMMGCKLVWTNHLGTDSSVGSGSLLGESEVVTATTVFKLPLICAMAIMGDVRNVINTSCPRLDTAQILIKTGTGSTITLNTRDRDNVRDLKEQILVKMGYVPESYRLLYEGKQLHDETTLVQAGITKRATLHLAGRLRGGAPRSLGTLRSGRSGSIDDRP